MQWRCDQTVHESVERWCRRDLGQVQTVHVIHHRGLATWASGRQGVAVGHGLDLDDLPVADLVASRC